MTLADPGQERAGTAAVAQVAAKLDHKKVDVHNSGADISTVEQIMLADARVRRHLAYAIMGLFAVVNLATLAFVYALFRVEQANLVARLMGAGDRIVNASVVMTLLGATTVQLGAAMLIMARFVFRPAVDRGGV